MSIKQVPANAGNVGGSRSASAIKYIVIHYTGNDGDTAAANAKYYANTVVKTSAHYFVDAKEIIQSVPDLRIAWAVGGNKYASCKQTGGGDDQDCYQSCAGASEEVQRAGGKRGASLRRDRKIVSGVLDQ